MVVARGSYLLLTTTRPDGQSIMARCSDYYGDAEIEIPITMARLRLILRRQYTSMPRFRACLAMTKRA